MTKIGLIWAQTPNRVIGSDNTIPWHLSEDLQHFNQITSGSTVVMGKSTWFSLPEKFRPLPNRRNLVLSSDLSLDVAGAESFSSLENAFASVDTEWAWVMGGQRVYESTLMYADRLEITTVNLPELTGDTFAPTIPYDFTKIDGNPKDADWFLSKNGIEYRFETYTR